MSANFPRMTSKVLFLSLLMVLQTTTYPMLVQPGWSLGDLKSPTGVIADGSDGSSAVGDTDDYTFDAVDLAANITDFDDDGIPDYMEDINGDGNYSNDDTDGDGLPNYNDTDDDNDGWLTSFECPDAANGSCPTTMGRADYLDANLYNCDAAFLSRSNGSHMQLALLDWTDYTLSNLTTVRYNDTSTLARSFEDGRVYWLSESVVYAWNQTGGVNTIVTTDLIGSVERLGFNATGELLLTNNGTLRSVNLTSGSTSQLATLPSGLGELGDLYGESNGSVIVTGVDGSWYRISNDYASTWVVNSNAQKADGVLELANGTVLASNGARIVRMGSPAASISAAVIAGTPSDEGMDQDMASCPRIDADSDGDGVPDMYEVNVFGTDPNNTDSDGDGMSDGREVQTTGTDPAIADDSDSDGVYDWFDEDDNNDGMPDWMACGVATDRPIANLGFEQPGLFNNTTVASATVNSSTMVGWQTDATSGFTVMSGNNSSVSAAEGDQYLRLNVNGGNQVVWQNRTLWEGDYIMYNASHRATGTQQAAEQIGIVVGNASNAMYVLDTHIGSAAAWSVVSGDGFVEQPTSRIGIRSNAPNGVTGVNYIDDVELIVQCFRDYDGDGVRDTLDDDIDGDGLNNTVEFGNGLLPRDSDGDGMPDLWDFDSDNDLANDSAERIAGSDTTAADTDGDGLEDWLEILVYSDLADVNVFEDYDNDNVSDWLDDDDDNDGVPDNDVCYGPGSRNEVYDPSFEFPYEDTYVTEGEAVWESNYNSGGLMRVEIMHANSPPHGDQHLEVELVGNTVVWQDMPFWKNDLIRWSMYHRARVTSEYTELSLMLDNASGDITVTSGVPVNAVEIANLQTTSPTWAQQSGIVIAPIDAKQFVLDPIEPATGAGNYVDMVVMNRTCMRDLDGDGIRDTIDQDIDGDGYNNSVEISPDVIPTLLSGLNDTIEYDFVNDAGNGASYDGWSRSSGGGATWWGSHNHCDNSTASGNDGHLYWASSSGHFRSPVLNLTGLGAATLNFFVNVDANCRDPVDEFEYMEVRWRKLDGTLVIHAEAPPMPVQWMRNAAHNDAYDADYRPPGFLIRNDASTDALNPYAHGYTFTIELPAEAIHANTQIYFDFPTGRDNSYSNIQIDDVLIHSFRYADTDDDGLLDIVDLDSDGDGLLDADELAEGTNRTNVDSDGDQAWDGHEVNYFDTDPLGPDDADGDLIPDWYDLDRNGDGVPDPYQCYGQGADWVQNGGFEFPGIYQGTSSNSWKSLGETWIYDWSLETAGSLEIFNASNAVLQNNARWPDNASEGTHVASLSSPSFPEVWTEVTTNPGDLLTWSVDFLGSHPTTPDKSQIRWGVSAIDSTKYTVLGTMENTDVDWLTYQGSLIVDGENDDYLTFDYVSAYSSGEGNYIDNVVAIASCISDLDGDGITDAYDDDVDGDGILNSDEYGWDLDFDSTPEVAVTDEFNQYRPNGEWKYFGNNIHDFRFDGWHSIYEEGDDFQRSLSFRGLGHSDYNSVTMPVEFDEETDVSFDYYVNSENNYDWLVFCVDFTQCAWQNSGYTQRWSGSVDGRHTETIAAGSHTLTWGAYTNGGSTHHNGNDFWIDNISIGNGLYEGDFDSDHDGVPDLRDLDSDGDTLLDEDEDALGTDPTSRDSDGDLMPDGYEIHWFDTNPLDANDDYDNDGITDWKDLDIDGDGVYNARECYNDQGTGSPSEDKQYAGAGLTELYWVDEGTFEDAANHIGTSNRLASTSYSYPVSGAHWMQQHVEFHNGSQSTTDGYIPAFDGDQYMSLQWNGWNAANDISYLVTTSPGDLLIWGFAHAGHYNGHSGTWDELRVRMHTGYGEQLGTQVGYSYGTNEEWRYISGAYVVPTTYGQYAYMNIGDTARRDWNEGQYIDGLTFTSYCRVDSDNDGVLNYYDDDSDDDGFLDSEETWDTDGDGWLDLFELDSDGDGINDDMDDDPRSAGKADWQGHAIEFTTNGVIQFPDDAAMDHDDHTVQMWVLPNATINSQVGQYSTVYSDLDGEYCDTASEGYAIIFDSTNNRFGVELQNGFGTSTTECKSYWMASNTAYEGTWTHLTVVFDDGKLYMLTDGGAKTSTWSSVPLTINDRQRPILGGEDKSSNPQHDEPFLGWIDEFRWWNRSLYDHEISTQFNRRITEGNDLVALYGFENISSGYTAEETGSLSPAFIRNGGHHVTSAPLRDPVGAGHYYSFNGKSDEIQTLTRTTTGVDYSAEAWIRTTDTDSLTFIASEDRNGGTRWELKMAYGYVGVYESNVGTAGASSSDSDLFVADGLWHHVAFTKNRNCLYVFVDGVLEASRCAGGVGSTDGSARVTVGGSYGAYGTEVQFAGDMDEFRLWDHALSPEDVARRMTTTMRGDESGLLLYYAFDGGAGKEVKDDSFDTRRQTMVYGETTWSRLGRGYADGAPVYSMDAPSQAAVIDGVGLISEPILDVRLMGAFTLEAMVQPYGNQSSSQPTVFSTVDENEGGFAMGVSLDANGDGGVDLAWGDVLHRMEADDVTPNEWVHVAVVYDETSLHVYTNGTYLDSWTPSNRNDPGGLGVIRVGTHVESGNTSRTFSGAIDALHLWAVPLSAQNIADTWDLVPPASHPDLMASWTFDGTAMKANPFTGESFSYNFESGLQGWDLAYRWGTARSRDWCNAYARNGYSIRLASGNGTSNEGPSLTSPSYDMGDAEFAQIKFGYNSWTRCWDAQDANDVLYLEYLDDQGSWQEISDYPRQRKWYNTMVPNTVRLPADALYDGVQLRFRYYANWYDYIFLDDITVEYGQAPSSARVMDVTPSYALSGATVSDVDNFHLTLDTVSGNLTFIDGPEMAGHSTSWGVIDLESSQGAELYSDAPGPYVNEVGQDHPSTLTLEGWFRPETLRGNDWNVILSTKSCRNFATADGYNNVQQGYRSLTFALYDSAPSLIHGQKATNNYHYHTSYITSNNEVVVNGEWNHIAWVIDVSSSTASQRWMKGYVNGVHVTTNTLNDGYSWTGAMDTVSLGENNYRCDGSGEDRYDGQIGSLRMHPNAFTQDEIRDRMWSMPVDEDAIFAYDFTEGNEYVTDLTGNFHLSMSPDESSNVYNQGSTAPTGPYAPGNLRDADDAAFTWRTVGTAFGPSTNNVEVATPIPVGEGRLVALTSDDDTGMWLDYPSGDTVVDVSASTHRFTSGGIAFDDLHEEEFTAAGTTNATVRLQFDLEAMDLDHAVQNELRLLIDNGTGYTLHALTGTRSADLLTFGSVPFVLGSTYRLGYVEAPGNFTYVNTTVGFENNSNNAVKPTFLSGDVQSCSASSNLPAGLSVAANCTVSGTPTTQFWPPINVTFTATGPAGSVSTVMNMAVLTIPRSSPTIQRPRS
ncbi:MAG: LamG-like jellyroll fold domain-containing protein [Poseidonia sp.]